MKKRKRIRVKKDLSSNIKDKKIKEKFSKNTDKPKIKKIKTSKDIKDTKKSENETNNKNTNYNFGDISSLLQSKSKKIDSNNSLSSFFSTLPPPKPVDLKPKPLSDFGMNPPEVAEDVSNSDSDSSSIDKDYPEDEEIEQDLIEENINYRKINELVSESEESNDNTSEENNEKNIEITPDNKKLVDELEKEKRRRKNRTK